MCASLNSTLQSHRFPPTRLLQVVRCCLRCCSTSPWVGPTKCRSGSLDRRLSDVREDEPFAGDIAPGVQGDLDALLPLFAELDEPGPDAPGWHEPGCTRRHHNSCLCTPSHAGSISRSMVFSGPSWSWTCQLDSQHAGGSRLTVQVMHACAAHVWCLVQDAKGSATTGWGRHAPCCGTQGS